MNPVTPGPGSILSKVFLSENMQLKLTKYCSAFSPRYSNDNTKCYSKQCIGRSNTKTEQNFNPGLALIGLSGTGPSWEIKKIIHTCSNISYDCITKYLGH